MLYNQSSSIVLDETSSYWSVTKTCKILGFSLVNISKSGFHWSAFRNQQGSTFTETNRNGFIHHIGCLITLSDRNGLILVVVSTDFEHTGCLITPSDRNGPILDLLYPISTIFLTEFQPILADLIAESDKAVRAVHSCKCWFTYEPRTTNRIIKNQGRELVDPVKLPSNFIAGRPKAVLLGPK